MSKSNSQIVSRRGELLAELFLEELNPEFMARSPDQFGYDFLVGFPNSRGGINNISVEVKSTERVPRGQYVISKRLFDRLSRSNTPALLLVADVKDNKLFFAWLTSDLPASSEVAASVRIQITEINDITKEELRDKLRA